MWQMVFTYLSVKGWIIDPNVQSLFYCPNLVQVLPTNNFEIIDGNTVTTGVTMVIYGRGGFQVFLEPFYKSSRGLSNIFLITVCPVTMITVDGDIRRFLMVVPPLQCTCIPNFLPMFLMLSLSPP